MALNARGKSAQSHHWREATLGSTQKVFVRRGNKRRAWPMFFKRLDDKAPGQSAIRPGKSQQLPQAGVKCNLKDLGVQHLSRDLPRGARQSTIDPLPVSNIQKTFGAGGGFFPPPKRPPNQCESNALFERRPGKFDCMAGLAEALRRGHI